MMAFPALSKILLPTSSMLAEFDAMPPELAIPPALVTPAEPPEAPVPPTPVELVKPPTPPPVALVPPVRLVPPDRVLPPAPAAPPRLPAVPPLPAGVPPALVVEPVLAPPALTPPVLPPIEVAPPLSALVCPPASADEQAASMSAAARENARDQAIRKEVAAMSPPHLSL
jgi:hypothetical protein